MTEQTKQRILQTIRGKIKQHYKKTWCGYLTPIEAKLLLEEGIRPNKSCEYQFKDLIELIRKGDSSPRWFYFELGKFNAHTSPTRGSRQQVAFI